jgi:hypothetical protein
MKEKYFIPFETTEERDRIRNFTGITAGATLTVKSYQWDSMSNAHGWEATWTEGYVVTITKPKAAMLLKLHFGEASKYTGTSEWPANT